MPDTVFDGPRLTGRDFDYLATLIERRAGIRMPATKRTMVEGRLRRRLRQHGMGSYAEYCRFLFEEGGLDSELPDLIDAITTNKTEFFREPAHFQWLADCAAPELSARGIGIERPLRIWSAGCSIGAEPYSMAMTLAGFGLARPGFTFQVLGTDVSTQVLETARKGIYSEDMAERIAPELRRRHLLRSRDRGARQIRMAPELRALVEFRQLNFMDTDFRMRVSQDVVFCRNVIIYFDTAVRAAVLGRICRHLATGGYLVMGHSETLTGLTLPLRQVVPTVYRRV
jgi:chemotaxis protein methyltransferase CheR